jgi:hypothetical protein
MALLTTNKFLFQAAVILLLTGCGQNTPAPAGENVKQETAVSDYHPKYWLEGIYAREEGEAKKTQGDVEAAIENAKQKGWDGVYFWGADRDGEKMNYYFKSPFLEKQDWAVFKSDGLSPIVTAAHKKGLGVIINIEGVNPYHWEKNKWTPENIKAVANDLAADSVDGVFEECFEVSPEVFKSLAQTLASKNVKYISGTDPMLFRESNFTTLWPETAIVNIYNYYLKRDKIFNIATLAQHGSLGYGWAKYWGKPTSLISPANRNWGISGDYSPAVIPYLCMIRALQFRLDNFMIWGGLDKFDPVTTQKWISEYVGMQEQDRPLMDIVVLLDSKTDNQLWNRYFNSGDAITSGAFNAGYNVVVSDKVVPADAYYIYAKGGGNENLPPDVIDLFNGDKPVFIQCGGSIPNGKSISAGWKAVLEKCGIDGTKAFGYGGEEEPQTDASLPPNQESDLPYTGYYNNVYLRFTGADVQRGMDLRAGTVIPAEAISGKIFCAPNKTYGKGPYITGKDKKYVVTATTLNWEAAYPISDLLSGSGILPSSNVWGIAGKNVTALLAIETTELEIKIPGMQDGSMINVVIWDNKMNKKSEEIFEYKAPFKQMLKEYDFILINKVNN